MLETTPECHSLSEHSARTESSILKACSHLRELPDDKNQLRSDIAEFPTQYAYVQLSQSQERL